MTSRRSSAGDPTRTLRLLWRDPEDSPRHGPRQGLSIDAVVATATGIADAHGLEVVTMRRVAQALGVAPMTLYTYVPGKDELLDVMLDAAYAEMPRSDTSGLPWRQRLTAVAEENRELFRGHPWAALVSTGRPPLGPGATAKYEHELAAFDGLGLDDVDVDACLAHLLGFVQSCARAAVDARAARADSGVTDEQWWAANAPLLSRVLDPNRFPRATRIGAAAGAAHGTAHDPEHAYEFGLARLLDGLGRLIDGERDVSRS